MLYGPSVLPLVMARATKGAQSPIRTPETTAGDDALLRNRAAGNGEAAIGFSVEDDGDECANARRLREAPHFPSAAGVARNHADDERDSDGNGKGDGEPGHIDRGHQQQVRQIENGAADHGETMLLVSAERTLFKKLVASWPVLPMVSARISEIRKMPTA
jgi:hypothetical protein